MRASSFLNWMVGAVAIATSTVAAVGCSTQVAGPAEPAAPPLVAPAAPAAPCAGDGFGAAASFKLDRATLRGEGATDALLAKLDGSAYRYFRLLARPFEARTCHAFEDLRWRLPVVAIHGDAHLEQFVVTHESYGLEDFDQAGFGPAVVDLVRYATSIHLACRELKGACDADHAVAHYFDSYRAALDHAPVEGAPPSVVERLRARSPRTRAAWLDWAQKLMVPLPAEIESTARAGWTRFVALQLDVNTERPASFYDIEKVGALTMGFGSATERKLLVRIRGATADPGDDLILEARAGDASRGPQCIARPKNGGSMQVLTFMAVLGRRLPDVFGFVTPSDAPGEREFWVQAWDPGYTELSIEDVAEQEALDAVVTDAANQLAGHFWTRFPEALRGHQRHAQLVAFDATRARAERLSRELADEVVREWTAFRASAGTQTVQRTSMNRLSERGGGVMVTSDAPFISDAGSANSR